MSTTTNIDLEWENFISSNNDEDALSDDEPVDIDDLLTKNANDYVSANILLDINSVAPKPSDIYISTKTKIAYLNRTMDLKNIFWDIPVIPYSTPSNGVIKKQMKFNSTEKEEVDFIQNKIKDEPYFEENVIIHIDNPSGRIKFKDIRKISIGISKKDILSYRCKKKSAFYNCFVIILRMKIEDKFKEFHVKVFNTGKLEIPGVQNETTFQLILDEVVKTIQPHIGSSLGYKPDTNETVLINSNFNCGYFINREALNDILKFKYNIQSMYDPCSYPGIQCKFYYNPDSTDIQNGCKISEENKHLYKNVKEVSFMIFRTGSVLIVGKCDENVLMIIYDFLKIILTNEYVNICQNHLPGDKESFISSKDKAKKIRRKTVMVEFSSETS
jgi:hypothetical protein